MTPRVGVDVQEIAAVARSAQLFGRRYLDRVYTPAEICASRSQAGDLATALAVRFAAKEAVFKLFDDVSGISHTDVEIMTAPAGDPSVRLSGAAQHLAYTVALDHIAVSTSHQGHHAFAFAFAMSRPGRERGHR